MSKKKNKQVVDFISTEFGNVNTAVLQLANGNWLLTRPYKALILTDKYGLDQVIEAKAQELNCENSLLAVAKLLLADQFDMDIPTELGFSDSDKLFVLLLLNKNTTLFDALFANIEPLVDTSKKGERTYECVYDSEEDLNQFLQDFLEFSVSDAEFAKEEVTFIDEPDAKDEPQEVRSLCVSIGSAIELLEDVTFRKRGFAKGSQAIVKAIHRHTDPAVATYIKNPEVMDYMYCTISEFDDLLGFMIPIKLNTTFKFA